MTLVTASVQLGSSRRPPRQWNVQLRRVGDGQMVVVAANLRRGDADRLAGRVNELLGGPGDPPGACAVCGAAILRAGTGRPRMYCCDGCKHTAWRGRRR